MIKVEEKRRRIEASFLDDLLKDLSKSMIHGLAERVEDGARSVVHWSLKKLAFTLVGIGVVITAAALILVAGVQGLMAASVPVWLSYLIAGGAGLGAGLGIFLVNRK